MNKQCFRLVFNQHRGRQVAVSELASSEQSRGSVARRNSSRAPFRFQRLSPLMVGLSMVFPTLSWSHNIVADKQAPGTQQAIVLKAANGVPLINIQTPNDKGVSINQFSHLDVDRQGAIFNNSQRAVQTQLGGWVQSNPWVLGKEAKLIVNQVNSRDPSYLQGFIEVAGRAADMVIANPAGIQVDGAGFINIPQITLTTGLPQYHNGALTGLAVHEGQITVLGEGLDATRTNATRLFAKALELRAGVFANQLDVVTGSNNLSPEGKLKATTTAQSQSIAIDTKAIGGMYAQSIYLLVTDKGAGVNNGGQWFAGSGGLTLDSEGNLTNTGSIVVADKSSSSMDQSTLTIKTDTINNTGSLSGEGRTQINTRTLNNDGLVASTSELVLRPTETLQNTGNINASRLDIQTQTLINTQGQIVQTGSMALSVDVGHLSQSQGSYLGGLALSSHQDSGSSTGSDSNSGIDPSVPASNETGLTITLPPSTAQGGGDTPVVSSASATLGNALPEGVIKVQDRLSNTDGKIVANAKTRVTSHARLKNEASSLLVDQLEVKSEGLTNRNGTIEASQVTIKGDDVINDKGRLSVEGNLTANITQTFNNTGRIETLGNLIVTDDGAQTLTLTNTGEVFSVHNILLQGKTFTNSGALAADHDIQFQGISFRNTGTVKAVHDLDVNLVDDYRVKVPLQAGHDLTLKTQGNVYAYSTLEAGHDVNVDTHRMKVEADGQVTAGNNAQLHVTNGLSNRGLINSQGLTAISTGTQVYNGGTGRIYGNHVAIKTTDLMNREETVDGRTTAASIVARDRLDIAAQKVVNREHSLIASEGNLYIGRYMNAAHWASGQAEKVENGSATIESGGDMTIEAKRLRNLNLHFKSEVKEVPGSRKEHVQDYLRDEENDMTYYTRNDITDTGKRGVIYFKGRRTEDYWLMDYTYYETQPYQ